MPALDHRKTVCLQTVFTVAELRTEHVFQSRERTQWWNALYQGMTLVMPPWNASYQGMTSVLPSTFDSYQGMTLVMPQWVEKEKRPLGPAALTAPRNDRSSSIEMSVPALTPKSETWDDWANPDSAASPGKTHSACCTPCRPFR